MNAERLLAKLIEASDALCEIIDRENRMLMQANPKLNDEHLQKKDLLARVYEGQVKELDEFREEIKSADQELRKRADQSGDRLKEAISLNIIRIRARYDANVMLLESYSKAVSETSGNATSYSDSGQIRKNTGSGNTQPARPATLSQTL